MLNTALLHPEILKILATSGHHSLVLIADGNYPAATKRGPVHVCNMVATYKITFSNMHTVSHAL